MQHEGPVLTEGRAGISPVLSLSPSSGVNGNVGIVLGTVIQELGV